MDVELPDGTVVEGVPDGLSQRDLVSMLAKNGHDTSWYKEPKAGLIDRVKSALTPDPDRAPMPSTSDAINAGWTSPPSDAVILPGSVMDGYTPTSSDQGVPIDAGVGPMRKDYYDTTRAGLISRPVQEHAAAAQGGGQVGKVAADTLPGRVDRMERDLAGTGQARTAQEVQDDAMLGRLPGINKGTDISPEVTRWAEEFAKESPRSAEAMGGVMRFGGGVWGAASALLPEGSIPQEVADASAKFADALATEQQKQDFTAADDKIGWMISQALANAPSAALSMIGMFNPASAPLVLGAMASSSGGGQFRKLMNAGVDRDIATAAGIGYGIMEAAFERMEIGIGSQLIKRLNDIPINVLASTGRRIMQGATIGAGKMAVVAAVEGGEEVGTELGQIGVDVATGGAQAARTGPSKVTDDLTKLSLNQVANKLINAGMGGIAGGMGVAGAQPAISGYEGYRAGDLSADRAFDPGQIDAAARQALDPANAQIQRTGLIAAPAVLRAQPADILAAPDVDTAIAAAVDSVAASQDEFSDLLKAEQSDLAYLRRDSAAEAAKAADFARAKEQQADIQIDQANALTRAQGFDEETPTAMQLALQRAKQKTAAAPVQTPPPVIPVTAQPEPAAAAPNVDAYLKQNAAGKWQLSRPVELAVKDAVIAEMDRRNQEGAANAVEAAQAQQISAPLQDVPQAAPEAGALPSPDQLISAIRTELEAADKRGDLNGVYEASQRLDAAVTDEVQKRADSGEMAVFKGGNLTYAVHPATDGENAWQVTTYNDSGALGDTRYKTLTQAIKDSRVSSYELLDAKAAAAEMDRLAKAEGEYQARKNAPAAPAQAKAITRTKNGKLEISGFSREDVAGTIRGVNDALRAVAEKKAKKAGFGDDGIAAEIEKSKIRATITVGNDGRVLVSAVGRTGNHMPMTIKQAKAIETALMGKTARAPKARKFTGNLKNDLDIMAKGLFTEVRNGGDGERNDAPWGDVSLVAERLRDEHNYMLPHGVDGQELANALRDLIREHSTESPVLTEKRQAERMTEAKTKEHRANVLSLADEYSIPIKNGIIPRALTDIENDLAAAIEEEIGVAGRAASSAYDAAIAAGIPENELDAIIDKIAVGYTGDTSRDVWVKQYREQAKAFQEAIDADQGREGRDTQDEGAGDNLPPPQGSEERPTLELASQTEAEFRAKQERVDAAEAQRLKDEQAAENKRAADADRGAFTLTGSDRPADTLAAQGQGGLFDAPARGEVGSSLTKEQRKAVMQTLTDVYKTKGAPKESKGLDQNGNERVGYAYSPELFEKSDITGAPIRYVVTLPDGRIAHPTELFPDMTLSKVEALILEQEGKERDKADQDKFRREQLERRKSDTLNEANSKFNRANPGLGLEFVPALLTDGKQFIRAHPDTVANDLRLLGGNWVEKPLGLAAELDRRKDAPQRKRIEHMTPEEMRKELLTDALTGIGNRRAYDEADKLPVQVSIDADSLKWINDNLGHHAGDESLKLIANAIAAETNQAFHLSGDEFAIQANTEDDAARIMAAVQNRLNGATLEAEIQQSGEIVTLTLGVSYGTGKDLKSAERGLQEHKQAREREGLRAARGEEPPSATRSARVEGGTAEVSPDNAGQVADKTLADASLGDLLRAAADKADGAPKPKKPKATDPMVAIREFYTPGNIYLSDYWKTHSKVLEFKEGGQGAGSWDVKVVTVKKDGDQWVETEQPRWHSTAPGKSKVVDRVSAYTPPKSVKEAQHRWSAAEFGDPKPERTAGHVALMDAVRKALAAKLFYNKDVDNFVAKELGVTAEQRKIGSAEDPVATESMDRVEGGAFGYDVYLARQEVESENAKQAELVAAERMKLSVGMNVGKLKLNDGKLASAATVESLTPTSVVLVARRGPQKIRITTGYVALEYMADRAENDFFKNRAPSETAIASANEEDGGLFAQQDEGKEPPASLPSEAAKEREASANSLPVNGEISTPAISDFGEKIGGAKKDIRAAHKDAMKAAEKVDISAEPLSKSWPVPDYQALIDAGSDPWVVAFMRSARDAIPRKPSKSWKLKGWVAQVELLRKVSNGLLNGLAVESAKKQLAELAEKSSEMRRMASRIELYELVGHRQSLDGVSLNFHHYALYKGEKNVSLWTVEKEAAATAMSNWPREIATGDTKEEVLSKFKALYDQTDLNPPAAKEQEFVIYVQGGKYYVGKKLGRNPVELAGPFATVAEARAYRTDNVTALAEKLAKFKEIPRSRRESNEPRVGEDMRNGQDVTPEMFMESFGFRGVEFGNWVEQKKRQKDLNEAFDALMDMAAIIGVPARALSLNGELGLAFGARGNGGVEPAAAHYESDKIVINLTKKAGAGSLGHEFFHALDNYFSRLRGKGGDFTTEALDVSLASRQAAYHSDGAIRKEMVEAFGAVMRAIRNTALKARSSKLDAKRSKSYWTTDREMAARAFESYLISKLQDQNAANDYLANIVDEETWAAAEKLGFELDESYPYPTAGEVPVIRAGFDNFFQTVKTKETDKGIALESRADLSGREFWRKIRSHESFTAKELEDALSIGRRGTTRSIDMAPEGRRGTEGAVSRLPDSAPLMGKAAARQNVRWGETLADFAGYRTVGIDAGEGVFIVGAIPTELYRSDSLEDVLDTQLVGYRFTKDGDKYRLEILDPPQDSTAYIEAEKRGRIEATGQDDENGVPYHRVKLDNRYTTSRALLQESVRRLALNIGEVPTIIQDARGTGARAGDNIPREFSADEIDHRFSKDPAATITGETPDAIRAGLRRSLGKATVDRLEQSGLLRILDTADSLPDGLTISDAGTALYDGKTAYLIADRMTPADAVRATLHEIGEHHGLEGMLGEQGYKTLTNRVRFMEKAGDKRVRQAFNFVREAYPEYEEKTDPRFMKEVLANIGQDADVRAKPWWQEMIAAVRRFLVKLGYGGMIRTGDIEDMVLYSLKTAAREDQSEDSRGMVEAMASKADDAVADLNQRIEEEDGIGGMFAPIDFDDGGVSDAFTKTFGTPVVFIKPNRAEAEGFMAMQWNGRIYVDPNNGKAGFVNLLGHELLHDIRKNNPNLYAWFDSKATQFLAKDSEERYGKLLEATGADMGRTNTREEILADFVGDSLADPVFMDWLANENKSKFMLFVSAVRQWFNSAIGRMTDAGLGSSEYINDVRGLQEYLGAVLSAYRSGGTAQDAGDAPKAARAKVGAGKTALKAVDTESADMVVEGFSSFEAVPNDDGSVNFYGTAKVKGEKYYATIKVTHREDGSPKIELTDYRFETMTGKNVRGAANVTLEDLMDTAKEAALAWAVKSRAFSATNPSILESRQGATILKNALDLADSLAGPSVKTLGSLNNVVTQLHKARRDPKHFGPVFNLAMAFRTDLSRSAYRSWEMAKDILPAYDDIRTAVKTLVMGRKRQKEVTHVGTMLFEGTTYGGGNPLAGMRWTHQQLKDKYQATDKEIELYDQARAAIDSSLTEVSNSIAWKLAKPHLSNSFKAEVISNPETAEDTILEALEFAKQSADEDGKATIDGAIQSVNALYEQAYRLKAAGYTPLSRFGRYTVDVFEVGQDGKIKRDIKGVPLRLEFKKFDFEAEARAEEKRLKQQYADRSDVSIERGIQAEGKLFAGVDPETVALFVEQVSEIPGLDIKREVLDEWRREAVSQRSAITHNIKRKGVAGYSEDMPRVLATFLTSNARYASANFHMADMLEAVNDIPDSMGDVKDDAAGLYQYINANNEPGAWMRGLMFAWYLGGSPAAAAVNMTQPVLMTLPYLQQFGNASKYLLSSVRQAMQPNLIPTKLRLPLTRAMEEGIVEAQEIHHLYAEGMKPIIARLPGGEGLRARAQSAATLWGAFFGMAENFNRRISFLAAHKMADEMGAEKLKARGFDSSYAFARRAVEETQGIYAKENRPNWARGTGTFGAVGVAAFTFKQFSIQYVELLTRMYRSGPEGKMAAGLMLGLLILASGLQGVPGADDLDDLIDTILQSLGYRGNVKKAKRDALKKLAGERVADIVMYGLSAETPIDVQARLGLGNILPATGLFKPSEQNKAGQIAEFFGPPGGMAKSVGEFIDATQSGQRGNAFSALSPVFVRNIAKAYQMADTGEYKDTRGRKVENVDLTDAAIKGFGFQPQHIAAASRKAQMVRQDIARVKDVEADIAAVWAQGVADKKPDEVSRARAMLKDWNEKNKETPIRIDYSQILRRVKEMKKERSNRLEKTAPRELRGYAREGLN